MIALDPERSADEICCFIGTTAAIIMAATAAASAGSSIYAANKTASTAQASAATQAAAANRAAELEAQSSSSALDFTKQQEAERQAEWNATQARNFQIHQDDVAREQGRYDALQARLEPYRRFGAGAVSQMGQPIPGSMGALMGGRR